MSAKARHSGVTVEQLESFLRDAYETKDTMHDLTHVRRVHRAAQRLAADTATTYDPLILLIAAYLHGVVYVPARESDVRRFLADCRVPPDAIDRAVTAAWESQTDATPESAEGMLLHDGHLLEGGRSFMLVKALITGGARGSKLAEIVAFWERQVTGRFRCSIPAAQARYLEQEAFARAVFEDIRNDPGLERD